MQKVKIQELEKVLLTRRTFSPVREAFFVRILKQFCKLKKILILTFFRKYNFLNL